jgi:hypothetical protein
MPNQYKTIYKEREAGFLETSLIPATRAVFVEFISAVLSFLVIEVIPGISFL